MKRLIWNKQASGYPALKMDKKNVDHRARNRRYRQNHLIQEQQRVKLAMQRFRAKKPISTHKFVLEQNENRTLVGHLESLFPFVRRSASRNGYPCCTLPTFLTFQSDPFYIMLFQAWAKSGFDDSLSPMASMRTGHFKLGYYPGNIFWQTKAQAGISGAQKAAIKAQAEMIEAFEKKAAEASAKRRDLSTKTPEQLEELRIRTEEISRTKQNTRNAHEYYRQEDAEEKLQPVPKSVREGGRWSERTPNQDVPVIPRTPKEPDF